MTKPRVACLFGSGISWPSDAPKVKDITAAVLEKSWKSGTDQRIYPCTGDDDGVAVAKAKRAQDFLQIIKDQIASHIFIRELRSTEYEDLYSAAMQIVQDETADITNPLIAETVSWIRAATAYLYTLQPFHINRNRFASLAHRAAELIQWSVYHELCPVITPNGLAIVSEIAKASGDFDIFTLNHDLLVEAQFNRDHIDYTDGFGERDGDVTFFDGSWDSSTTRLLKLHGSINWYLFRIKNWDRFGTIRWNSDVDHCKAKNGDLLNLSNFSPVFLSGTTVKEQAYGVSLFGEVFSEFRKRLSSHRTLICCGYGWADNGINIRLEQWLRDREENKIVILHKDPSEQLEQKKFWRNRWEKYTKTGKVEVVHKWLCCCNLADLEPYFD